MRKLNYKQIKLLRFIEEIYGDTLAGKRILDAGGWEGLLLNNLPRSLRKVILDIERECLLGAKQEKVYGDVRWLPFRDQCFDVCIFSEVLEHVQNSEKAVAEVTRVADEIIFTSPNNSLLRKLVILPGLVIRKGLSFAVPKHHHIDILGTLRGRLNGVSPAMSHVRTYSWKEVKDFFENRGFKLMRFEAISSFLSKPKFLARLERFPRFGGKMMMHFKRITDY